MAEVRADELKKGDRLMLKGHPYVVLKAKVHGKTVHLVVDGRGGTFTSDVKAKTRYDRFVAPSDERPGTCDRHPAGTGPLTSGQQELSWDEPASKAESKLIDRLGAKLVAVEVAGGKLVVPPVDDTTLFGHLVTMHRVRYDGVTFDEAKAWSKTHDPAAKMNLEQTTTALALERARALHDQLHVDFSAIPVPHWHREKAPR